MAPIDIEEGFGGNITIDLHREEYTDRPQGLSAVRRPAPEPLCDLPERRQASQDRGG